MRHIILLFAGLGLATTSMLHANAAQRITSDRGGLLIDYAERFAAASASGERVIIDGPCLSACTLAIGMLPAGAGLRHAARGPWLSRGMAPDGERPH
jgi:hypothetical protein